jgi:eukaryotic translation initiation factor 2C
VTLQDGTSTLNLGFELVRKLDVGTLQQYSNANPQYEQENFDAISKCLNMVISKTFDDSKLYRQAANKFFVKDARGPLLFPNQTPSQSLETVRGYYYTVKPGTGSIILNFNMATSAFFKPISVQTFLTD